MPSLNIHTNRTAEEPSVAGGAAVAGNNPVPWVVWRERDGATTDGAAKFQIFVSRGIAGAASCAGVTPGNGTPVNSFCFQQTGLKRLSATSLTSAAGDPTLNIDPTRNSEVPDIAFTGPSDTVPWTVWYEEDASGIGLRGNDRCSQRRQCPTRPQAPVASIGRRSVTAPPARPRSSTERRESLRGMRRIGRPRRAVAR